MRQPPQPFVFRNPRVLVDTVVVLREMAEAVGMAPAVFARAALEEFSDTGSIDAKHTETIARIRRKASVRKVGTELVACAFNVLDVTDEKIQRMAEAFDVRHYDLLRRALEAFTGTGHSSEARERAARDLRLDVTERLSKYADTPGRYRSERRKQRNETEREGLSVVASTRDTYVRRPRPSTSVRAATPDEPVRRRRRRPLRL